MLNDFTGADKVYIACGYTDLRKGIDGLAQLVRQRFELDSFTNTLFLFCGRRRYRSMMAVSKDTPLSRGMWSVTSPEVVVRFLS